LFETGKWIMVAVEINQTINNQTNKMKNKRIVSMAALLLVSLTAAQAQFTPGDLVVLQQNNGGSQAAVNTGNQIVLDQFSATTANDLVSSLAIPDTGVSSVITDGTAASEGQLSLSANDQYLVFAGYNVPVGGSVSLANKNTTAAQVPRAIGTVDANGNYTLAAVTTTFYGGNNMRGGASDGIRNFWGAGAASGTVYLGTGTPAQISSVNSISAQDIGGNLFYSSAKAATPGIYEISGAPTSGTATPTLLLANAGPSAFTFNANMTVAYVANTGSGANGGVTRYNFSGGVWTVAYTLDSNTAMNGVVADFSGTAPVIYATTEDGTSLVEITDAGAGTTSGATVLDTAGTNEDFRGLEFAPVPEPSALTLAGLGLAGLIGFRRHNQKS
jgi:hypothetical protein